MEVDWVPLFMAVGLVILALVGGVLIDRSKRKSDRANADNCGHCRSVRKRLWPGKWEMRHTASRLKHKSIVYKRIFKRGRPTWWVTVEEIDWHSRRKS